MNIAMPCDGCWSSRVIYQYDEPSLSQHSWNVSMVGDEGMFSYFFEMKIRASSY